MMSLICFVIILIDNNYICLKYSKLAALFKNNKDGEKSI